MSDETKATTSERTCAGCRAHDARDVLVRFVQSPIDGALVPDVRRKLPGRGVSVHPKRACLEAAVKRGGFARSLRHAVDVEIEGLTRVLVEQLEKRVAGLLLGARRAGRLAVGTDAVRDALRDRELELLVVARDAAGRREEVTEAAKRLGRACELFGDKAWLGSLFGRDEVALVGVMDEQIAREIAVASACISGLSEEA